MERSLLIAATGGVCLALCLIIIKQPAPATVVQETAPKSLGLAEADAEQSTRKPEETGNLTAGWVTVYEPKADWNVSDSDLIHFICPRPEWYPYHTFRGPPIPESTAGIDPDGYVLRTAVGVRLHRDGWVVTADGRAYRAEEVIE